MKTHRGAGSSVLLGAGVVLVFAGLSSALGLSLPGIVASVATIAALLYAGAVWFGEPRTDPAIVLFTPALAVAGGSQHGRRVGDLFPEPMRADIEARCRAALAGGTSHFTCGSGTSRVSFSATPVRDATGAVVYGLLLSGSLLDVNASNVSKAPQHLNELSLS